MKQPEPTAHKKFMQMRLLSDHELTIKSAMHAGISFGRYNQTELIFLMLLFIGNDNPMKVRPNPSTMITFLAVAAMAYLMFLLGLAPARSDAISLEEVERQVAEHFPEVSHISPEELALKFRVGEPFILLDVREAEEFAVSHLPRAMRVDPGIWQNSFMNRVGERVRGRSVVFYCSVGVRSSKLAAYVQHLLLKAGATAVYNLRGGIFAWHNQKRVLANGDGKTDFVHPYDKHWGQLLERKSQKRYVPSFTFQHYQQTGKMHSGYWLASRISTQLSRDQPQDTRDLTALRAITVRIFVPASRLPLTVPETFETPIRGRYETGTSSVRKSF